MRINRKALFAAVAAALVLATPLAAQARPFGHGGSGMGYGGHGYGSGPMMYQGGMQAIPQEKQAAFSAAMREHQAKMQPIREQLWAKRTLLEALSNNPKTEPKELTALVNEMAALRTQLAKEREAFATRMEKDFSVGMPYGGGYGPGHGRKGFGRHGGHQRGCY